MSSLSYQVLPRAFLEPVLMGLVPLTQAVELYDLWLLTPEGHSLSVPMRLAKAAEVIFQQEIVEELRMH